MSKNTDKVIPILFFAAGLACFNNIPNVSAEQPTQKNSYIVQVPHVVLPETIQYKPHNAPNANEKPATYTAYPSYQVSEETEFRSIGQSSYPVTAVSPNYASAETVAEIWNNRQIVPQKQIDLKKEKTETESAEPNINSPNRNPLPPSSVFSSQNPQENSVPKFEIPDMSEFAANQTEMTERSASFVKNQNEPQKSETPKNSIAFIKPKQSAETSEILADVSAPRHLNPLKPFSSFADDYIYDDYAYGNYYDNEMLPQRERESFFNLPVAYSEVAPPNQLNSLQPLSGFQQAQVAPAFGQSYANNYAYPSPQQQYQQYQPGGVSNMFGAPRPAQSKYDAASGLPNVWNAYLGSLQQRGTQQQSAQYQSMTQLGGLMPMMAGQGMSPYGASPYAVPQQYAVSQTPQVSPYAAGYPQSYPQQQQTIGYILLYPQAAQSGANLQLASTTNTPSNSTDTNADTSSDSTASASTDNQTNPLANLDLSSMQAVFIPASQTNYSSNYGSTYPVSYSPQQQSYGNPYAMNPMMMNPYAMMNPFMNPMMMGMGMGMTPPIIIQMPSQEPPRRMGFFARLRARRNSQNRYEQAATSLSSLYASQSPERSPAKAAYPYGYFGAASQPYQSGYFGGYQDMYSQMVRYPGN